MQGKGGFRPAAMTREDSTEGHCSEMGGQGHLLTGVRLKDAFILASKNPTCAQRRLKEAQENSRQDYRAPRV